MHRSPNRQRPHRSLARLREHFGDPLLVQVGRRMELSPLGDMLQEPVREALQKVESAISLRPDFDPATSHRHFAVCASEATVLALLAEVLRRLEQQAPGVSVELLPAEPARMGAMLDRRELDFVMAGENFLLPGHPHALVIRDDFLCAVWTGNKRVRTRLTMEQYLSLAHAITRYGLERRPGFEQFTLEKMGVRRHVAVSCTTPALLGPLVVGTQRIATLPSRLAREQARVLPLKLFPPPLQLPQLEIRMQWHRTRDVEGGTVWFRDVVLETARALQYVD